MLFSTQKHSVEDGLLSRNAYEVEREEMKRETRRPFSHEAGKSFVFIDAVLCLLTSYLIDFFKVLLPGFTEFGGEIRRFVYYYVVITVCIFRYIAWSARRRRRRCAQKAEE